MRRDWLATLDAPDPERDLPRKVNSGLRACSTPGCPYKISVSRVGYSEHACGRCRRSTRHERHPRQERSSPPEAEALRRLLTEIRLDAGLTCEGLSRAIGRYSRYASRVERGKGRLKVRDLDDWARACGFEVTVTFRRVKAMKARRNS